MTKVPVTLPRRSRRRPPTSPVVWTATASHASADAGKAAGRQCRHGLVYRSGPGPGRLVHDRHGPPVRRQRLPGRQSGRAPSRVASRSYCSMDTKDWVKVAENVDNRGDIERDLSRRRDAATCASTWCCHLGDERDQRRHRLHPRLDRHGQPQHQRRRSRPWTTSRPPRGAAVVPRSRACGSRWTWGRPQRIRRVCHGKLQRRSSPRLPPEHLTWTARPGARWPAGR